MKALSITPDFTLRAEVSNEHYMENLFGILRCFCEVLANVEHVDSYKMTPESIWRGMNILPEINFLELLQENTETIPANVATDIAKFQSRFGKIVMVGDDCLKVTDADILQEIKHNTRLNEMIYEYEDDLIFFEGDLDLFQSIMHNDLFCPIKFRNSKRLTYLLNDGKENTFVKATNPLQAIKSLYGKSRIVNEENLREVLKYKKQDVTPEAIEEFAVTILNNINSYYNFMIEVPNKANRGPVQF